MSVSLSSVLGSACVSVVVPLSQSAVQQWKAKGQVERVLWNHFQPDLLLVSRQEWGGIPSAGSDRYHGVLLSAGLYRQEHCVVLTQGDGGNCVPDPCPQWDNLRY